MYITIFVMIKRMMMMMLILTFKKASKIACTSTVVVSPDSSSPTSTSSAKTTAENTEENLSDPEPAHETDIQMEYSSDKLYNLSTGAEKKLTKNLGQYSYNLKYGIFNNLAPAQPHAS
jgi:hypothetical protein